MVFGYATSLSSVQFKSMGPKSNGNPTILHLERKRDTAMSQRINAAQRTEEGS